MEIVSRRTIDSPREQVYGAFSDPTQLAIWWGPKGFTNTISEFDLRPGGFWRFVMHGPDGTEYPNGKEFIEVVEPERIVFQHLAPVHRFRMTMTFAARGAATELSWRMLFESAEESGRLKDFILKANEENFDRLESHLKSRS